MRNTALETPWSVQDYRDADSRADRHPSPHESAAFGSPGAPINQSLRSLIISSDGACYRFAATSDHARLTSDQSLLRHLAGNGISNFVYQALNAFRVARTARTCPEELVLGQ